MKTTIKKITSWFLMLLLTFWGVGVLISSIILMIIELMVSLVWLPGETQKNDTFK